MDVTPVRILCVGKLKEDWQRAACAEYIKRLSRYEPAQIVEVPDLPESDPRAVEREGAALLARLRPGDFPVALCVDGEPLTSPAFARALGEWRSAGKRACFLIGGSLGLSGAAVSRSKARISLSPLTFPHALARVVLLEQLYRAHKILSGERYHK